MQEARLAGYSNFFGGMSALLKASAGENKRIQQAAQVAATTAATIDTFVAANKALANPPGPPFTIPAAAGAVLYGMANVARINKLHFAQGSDSPDAFFGRVPGYRNMATDSVTAMLTPGERVLTAKQADEYEARSSGPQQVSIVYSPTYNYEVSEETKWRDEVEFERRARRVTSARSYAWAQAAI